MISNLAHIFAGAIAQTSAIVVAAPVVKTIFGLETLVAVAWTGVITDKAILLSTTYGFLLPIIRKLSFSILLPF